MRRWRQAKAPPDEFRARRAALRHSLDDGVFLLKGEAEGYDPIFRFAQEPNFYYLTGWTEPGAALLLTPTDEILFLPRHDERAERYHGKRTSAEDADVHSVTGFDKVLPIEKLESQLDAALAEHARLYAPWTEAYAGQLRGRYPFREVYDATPLITQLRLKKSAAEIAAIQHATDVSIQAHRAAWRSMTAGQFEYQIGAKLLDTFLDGGCEGPAYSPIVGSGPNGPILHYMSNQRRMDRGELVLIDAGAQCDEYASDITRTVPVAGKFTPRQRESTRWFSARKKRPLPPCNRARGCERPWKLAHQNRTRLHGRARQGSAWRAAGQIFHPRHRTPGRLRCARSAIRTGRSKRAW